MWYSSKVKLMHTWMNFSKWKLRKSTCSPEKFWNRIKYGRCVSFCFFLTKSSNIKNLKTRREDIGAMIFHIDLLNFYFISFLSQTQLNTILVASSITPFPTISSSSAPGWGITLTTSGRWVTHVNVCRSNLFITIFFSGANVALGALVLVSIVDHSPYLVSQVHQARFHGAGKTKSSIVFF